MIKMQYVYVRAFRISFVAVYCVRTVCSVSMMSMKMQSVAYKFHCEHIHTPHLFAHTFQTGSIRYVFALENDAF